MAVYREIDNISHDLFESVLLNINSPFKIISKEPALGIKLLNLFDALKGYDSLFIHKVTEFIGSRSSFIIFLVEKHSTIVEIRNSGRRVQTLEEVEPILIFPLPSDVGRVLIRKETIGDKIADLFIKLDIDFDDHPWFSKTYFVFGDKPDLVRNHLPIKLIESLENRQEVSVEINGNWGLIRPEMNLSEDVLLLLLNIGNHLLS